MTGDSLRVLYRGDTHLATEPVPNWAQIECNCFLLPPFTWEKTPENAKLSCADCRRIERQRAKLK